MFFYSLATLMTRVASVEIQFQALSTSGYWKGKKKDFKSFYIKKQWVLEAGLLMQCIEFICSRFNPNMFMLQITRFDILI